MFFLYHSGLSRLEYRGYDSAGLAIDGDKKNEVIAIKEVGKVAALKKLVEEANLDESVVFDSHAGIAHTPWATHGPPSRVNCHPHRYVVAPFFNPPSQPSYCTTDMGLRKHFETVLLRQLRNTGDHNMLGRFRRSGFSFSLR